jgi:hypothetical protein
VTRRILIVADDVAEILEPTLHDEGDHMTEWRTLNDSEIVELATRLRDVDWTWQLEDVPALAAEFGWKVLSTQQNWVMLDDGFGLASGEVRGRDGRAESIELQVSDYSGDDGAGRAQWRDAFVRMTGVLSNALGEPTRRQPGRSPEIRWAGPDTTLQLIQLASIQLHLVTNKYLAAHDEAVALDEQGLL